MIDEKEVQKQEKFALRMACYDQCKIILLLFSILILNKKSQLDKVIFDEIQ